MQAIYVNINHITIITMLRELVRVKEVGLVYRIMIVEDDRELRETLKELLILKNYDVITAGSVKEFEEHTDIYDMYLLDVSRAPSSSSGR